MKGRSRRLKLLNGRRRHSLSPSASWIAPFILALICWSALSPVAAWPFDLSLFSGSKASDTPAVEMVLQAPSLAAPGDAVNFSCTLENRADSPLHKITICDRYGDLGYWEEIGPGQTVRAQGRTAPLQESAIVDVTAYSQGQLLAREEAHIKVIAAGRSALQAVVEVPSGDRSRARYKITNSGETDLHRIRVADSQGKTLGILARLDAGRSLPLITTGPVLPGTRISALDPAGDLVHGSVTMLAPTGGKAPSGFGQADESQQPPAKDLTVMSDPQPEASLEGVASQEEDVEPTSSPAAIEEEPQADPVSLDHGIEIEIEANRTEGRRGEVCVYNCTVRNTGEDVLYDVELYCQGHTTTTTFITPGRAFVAKGSLVIDKSSEIRAAARARDAQNRPRQVTSSQPVWEISPRLSLSAQASPSSLPAGEVAQLTLLLENNGNDPLTDIQVNDSHGTLGRLPALPPGTAQSITVPRAVTGSVDEEVMASARDSQGQYIYAFSPLSIHVYDVGLSLQAEPAEVVAYQGDDAEILWTLTNTGEETLHNVTLEGQNEAWCRLPEVAPGQNIRMAATLSVQQSGPVRILARAVGSGDRLVEANATISVHAIAPNLSLNVMPATAEFCAGEQINLSCLISNDGDDVLKSVVLSQKDGSVLARAGDLGPGEFVLLNPQLLLAGNRTLVIQASGQDSRGRTWTASDTVNAKLILAALDLKASASPEAVALGKKTLIRCQVTNRGSLPLYNIFVISKSFGPLGSLDFLPPKRSKVITAEIAPPQDISDTITAEGFTSSKSPVVQRQELRLRVIRSPSPRAAGSGDGLIVDPPLKVTAANNTTESPASPDSPPDSAYVSPPQAQAEAGSGNSVVAGIKKLVLFIQGLLTGQAASGEQEQLGVKSSRELPYSIKILDVAAIPPEPAAGQPVSVMVHATSEARISQVILEFGTADPGTTGSDMLSVRRSEKIELTMTGGSPENGYWSGNIPGQKQGTFMVISVRVTNPQSMAEDGPYMIQWGGQKQGSRRPASTTTATASAGRDGMLYIESTSVSGTGSVSIKDRFSESTISFEEKLKGHGNINIETLRCVDKQADVVNFSQDRDLSFEGGVLKGFKEFDSPTFHGGLGASITERFNASHIDKSEQGMIRSFNARNNTLAYDTEQAFDGSWNTRTEYARFNKKIKANQKYTGSFQTQKKIKFED